MEEVDTVSVAVSKIDINKVEALETRRVVAFINHFLCTTATFLNQFATKCESKLDNIQQKLFKIDSSLKILEAKLDSLPESCFNDKTENKDTFALTVKAGESKEINQDPSQPKNDEEETENDENEDSNKDKNDQDENRTEEEDEETSFEEKPSKESLKDDPRYAKYFKMLYVGVPVPAVRQKMQSEGVDPNILNG